MDHFNRNLIRGYQIGERVSNDRTSVLYRATQVAIGREVALRVILPEYSNPPDFSRRFEVEAQLIARLEHPHIVPLYDYWCDPEGAFLVMRWLPGNLQSAIQRGPWSVEATARLVEQVAEALAFTHREGVVHGRLKPDNIWLDEDENAYLTGFGIAEPTLATSNDSDPAPAGELTYTSPEQVRGDPLTVRTDVYRLGLVTYELLTGTSPYPAPTSVEELKAWQLNQPLPVLNKHRPNLSSALNEVVQTATAKDPLHRYATATRFSAAFQAALPVVQRALQQPLAEPLTDRELDILRLMLADHSNSQIAQALYLTPGTVKWYVQQLYRKLDVHSRRQAIDRAQQLKLGDSGSSRVSLNSDSQLTSVMSRPRPEAAPTHKLINPYKGLRAFQEADADNFFGRATLTEKLLARLADDGDEARFLAIVGPSGSGKSSAVRAGLIPALRQGALPNSERWLVADMFPGTHPLEELEATLLRAAASPVPGLLSQLSEDRRGLVRAVRRVLPADQDVELFLFIDQFEELFVLVPDDSVRLHFIDNLLSAATDPRSRIRIVVTLRADFYDRPLHYPRLAELLRSQTEIIVPLTTAELERAIAGPAEREGLSLEPGLVAAIVRDVEAQPGGLPLMQYALTELFERRDGLTLRRATYQAGGGISGALARRAEELYSELKPDGQAATRQVFLRLVRLGETTEDTRRRVRLAEIETSLRRPQVLDEVLTAFDRYRLLTFDRDPSSGEATVELAHEALLRAWQRLAGWIADNRQELRTHQSLSAAAQEWALARGDPGLLATGTRLVQFEALVSGTTLSLNAEERLYVEVSLAERKRREREHDTQQQLVALLRRALVGLLIISLVTAVGLSIFAFASRNEAVAQAEIALSRQLAVQAIDELQNPVGNDELAALLAIRSLNTHYNAEADGALIEAASRLPIRQFAGHNDEVYSAVFSPDGQRILTAHADHTARVWDMNTGQELLTLNGHADEVVCAAYSPDGRYIVTGSIDRTARLWDAATGRELMTFAGSTDEIHSVAVSPDNRYLLAGSYDGTASLWELATGRLITTYSHGEGNSIKGVTFSSDGSYVLTGSSDRTAKLWNTASGLELHTYSGHGDAVYSVAFSPDGRYLVTGSADNTAKVWETETGRVVTSLVGHSGSIRGIAVSPDGQTILTASGDNTVRLWEAATGEVLRTFRGHTDKIWTATFSPNGQLIVTSSRDGTAKLWAVSPRPVGVIYRGHTADVYDVAFSPDGGQVFTSSADGTARSWDTASGKLLTTFTGHTDQVLSVDLSSDGQFLLTASLDHTARLWNTSTGQLIRTLTSQAGQVLGAAFSPDGQLIVTTGGPDHTAQLWETDSGEAIHTLSGYADEIWDVAFSPDGRYLFTSSIDHHLKLWDAKTYQEVADWDTNYEIRGLAVSPDSKFALISAKDHAAQLWDIASGQPVRTLTGHTNTVYKVAFSPDGRYAITGSADRTAKIWDAASGVEVRTLSGHTNAVWGVAFSPDGQRALTGSLDGTARLWNVDYHDLVATVCSQLLRDFTDEERTRVHLEDDQPTCQLETIP